MLSISKKIICAILFITITLSLAACSTSSGKSRQDQLEEMQTEYDCSDSTEITATPTNITPPTEVVQTYSQSEPSNLIVPTETVHIHEYSISIVPPSCTDKGYSIHSCICGEKYNGEYTNPVGHA